MDHPCGRCRVFHNGRRDQGGGVPAVGGSVPPAGRPAGVLPQPLGRQTHPLTLLPSPTLSPLLQVLVRRSLPSCRFYADALSPPAGFSPTLSHPVRERFPFGCRMCESVWTKATRPEEAPGVNGGWLLC